MTEKKTIVSGGVGGGGKTISRSLEETSFIQRKGRAEKKLIEG